MDNIPTPIIAVILALILSLPVGIMTFFFKDLIIGMKIAIADLSKVVHDLEIVTKTMETSDKHMIERFDDLKKRVEIMEDNLEVYHNLREAFYKEYRGSLDFIKKNTDELNELIFEKRQKEQKK